MIAGMEPGVLGERLRAERDRVETALKQILAGIDGVDPVSHAVRYALQGEGKRLRPILCVAAFRAAGGDTHTDAALYRAATSIELIHTYSLVHDDLPCMDDDDLRRGRATTHRVFGNAAAVAAGFVLIPLACRVLDDAAAELGLPAAGRSCVAIELCRGAGAAGMVGGQVLDLEAEGHALDLERLAAIHARKTGALFRASLRIGATLAGASETACDALGEFGSRLGLAFQIADDVLDVTRDAGALGKTPGKDAASEKTTFASLLGVPGARARAADEAGAAIRMLRDAAIDSPFLEALAGFAVDRDR